MRILVTGGAGYIGSVMTEHLVGAGYDVVVLDNLSVGHRQAVHPGAVFAQGDVGDRAFLDDLLRTYPVDAAMHFASNTLPGESMERPFLYLRDNVVNGLTLIEALVEHGVHRFILSSTANLFDEPQRVPIAEDEAIIPGSPYGESKHLLERVLHWMDRVYGLRYATLRYFNAAGATDQYGEDHQPEVHLIPLVLQVALGKREQIVVFGDDYPTRDGTCIRDYVHVSDLAAAHVLALEALDQGSRAYNLGNGQGFTVREVIQVAREVTGHPIPAVVGARRPGDPAVLVAASERIRRELGWQPRFPDLDSIVASAWEWHRRHPDGYDE